MSIITNIDWIIQQLRVDLLKSEEQLADRIISFSTSRKVVYDNKFSYISSSFPENNLCFSPNIFLTHEVSKPVRNFKEENEKKDLKNGIKREDEKKKNNQKNVSSTPKKSVDISKQSIEPFHPKKSLLKSQLQSASTTLNPFSKDFSCFAGKGEIEPLCLKIYFLHSSQPKVPLIVFVKKDSTVDGVIGYALLEYVESKRQPFLPTGTKATEWNLRIVEDDGALDEDFPALERARKISKFSFDQFAIVSTTSNLEKVSQTQLQTENLLLSAEKNKNEKSSNYFIKVHLYSTLEVKQTTTVNVSGDMLLADVLELCCKKRKIDPSDYTLKMADTKTNIPLDKTLDSLALKEICLLKKTVGPSGGDIFLRPPEEDDIEGETVNSYETDQYTSVYKRYLVTRKIPMIMSKQERVLAIDGDYVYILPSNENRNLFDPVKTHSFHVSSVTSCKQVKKHPVSFKISFKKDGDIVKTYEFEATTVPEASEICGRISFMSRFSKTQSTNNLI